MFFISYTSIKLLDYCLGIRIICHLYYNEENESFKINKKLNKNFEEYFKDNDDNKHEKPILILKYHHQIIFESFIIILDNLLTDIFFNGQENQLTSFQVSYFIENINSKNIFKLFQNIPNKTGIYLKQFRESKKWNNLLFQISVLN